MDAFKKNIKTFDIEDIIALFPYNWIFWKDHGSIYKGCNSVFSDLLGLKTPNDIVGLKISNVKYIKGMPLYVETAKDLEEVDQKIFDCTASCALTKSLYFKDQSPPYVMNCKAFPLVNDSEKVIGVLGIGSGQLILPSVRENIFQYINKTNIGRLLKSPKYLIKSKFVEVSLKKREMMCLLYLLKGMTAKQISHEMCRAERSIEDLTSLIKDKLGYDSKSALVSSMLESSLLEELQRDLMKSVDGDIKGNLNATYLFDESNHIYIKT